MNNLFQQKQRELVMAASKVEELSRQLELLKNGKMENFHENQSSAAELDRLYKELQVCRSSVDSIQFNTKTKLSSKDGLCFKWTQTLNSVLSLSWCPAEEQTQPGSEL